MINFEFCSPTQFVFGRGAEAKVGLLVREFGGTKVLVHFGGGSIKRTGIYDKVIVALREAGVAFVELGGVQPNPREALVREGIALCRNEKIDFPRVGREGRGYSAACRKLASQWQTTRCVSSAYGSRRVRHLETCLRRMKMMSRNLVSATMALVAMTATAAVPFKNGTAFALKDVPGELVVERRAGEPVRFVLEENGTTGYQWSAEWNTNECDVVLDHRGVAEKNERGEMLCGAAGTLDVAVTSKIYTPARIEFTYRRPWEKGVKSIRALKLIVYTVGEAKSPIYSKNAVNRLLKAESPYPRPKFLKLAKEMGAKFSFGTNNFDPSPKDLSRWLEVLTWLDLSASDIWTP